MSAEMPTSTERPISPFDLVGLSRQTAGDSGLERELLAMFGVQAGEILVRLNEARNLAARQQQADLAHRLRGSALAVCANEVALEAGLLEAALQTGCDTAQASEHFEALAKAVARAESSLTTLLAA